MYVCQADWHIALVPGHFCNSLQKVSVNWINKFWFICVLYVHNCKSAICWKFQICNNWQICDLEQIAELQICKFARHKLDLQTLCNIFSYVFEASRWAYLQNCNLSKTFQNVHSNAGVSSGKVFLVYCTKCTYLQSAPLLWCLWNQFAQFFFFPYRGQYY